MKTQLTPQQQESVKMPGIGGSTIANILGIGYDSPLNEYNRILHPETRPDLSENPYVRAGIYLEPVIRQMAEDVFNIPVRLCNITRYHPDYPNFRANVDGKIKGRFEGIEFKNRGHWQGSKYGQQETDEVLDCELCQCLWYLGITGWQRWHLIVLIGGFDLRHFVIERDEEMIKVIFEKARYFWEENVLKKVPPAPTTLSDLKQLYPSDNGQSIVATPDIEHIVEALKTAKDIEKIAAGNVDGLELELKSFIGNNTTLVDGKGQTLASWKAQTTNRIDTSELKKELPEIAAKYTKATESRVLRIK